MTASLTTRGRVCHNSSTALSLISWGFICIEVRPFVIDDVRFGFEEQPEAKQRVYNKEQPPVFDPQQAGLFSHGAISLTGSASISLLGKQKRPSLMDPRSPGLYNRQAAQLTGAKVIRAVGKKSLLLSDPEEPTLTSSGTKVPDLFEKC